ncbi:MAG: UDP-N-acetylmuramoyl-tripeptide--D-alanyl-D-alanine ligase [Ignavibacteriaceae bacterium]|nr:UDP-N-acetylmuramoyl-tripeptide--D-alanyl-D-alanine ligase [Ignavibacteriaceae bacterium]
MKNISLDIKDLFEVPSAEIFNPDALKAVRSVSIDSRNIKKGSLFIAIKGNKFDGHDFIKEAIESGAFCVMINKKNFHQFSDLEIPFITVEDTVKALGDVARIWRRKLNTKVIALTGSAGKTTTKEMLSVLLREKFNVNKTTANNNNHIGVPLTILSTNPNHDVLVAELGTNHFGEIAYSAQIAQPDFSLITNIGDSHLEYLKNRSGVFKEKAPIFKVTDERRGTVFINSDDPILFKAAKNYKNKITFGFNGKSDVRGKLIGYDEKAKPTIEIEYKNIRFRVTLPVCGIQSAKNFLSASAVALKLGLSVRQIMNASQKLRAFDKRANVIKIKNFVLIDDSYNANPQSMRDAIELISKIKSDDKRVLILGDMFELGAKSEQYHRKLKNVIIKNRIDVVLLLGKMMKHLKEELQHFGGIVNHFRSRAALVNFINDFDFSGSAVLIKGSRGMKMEEFVNKLKEIN